MQAGPAVTLQVEKFGASYHGLGSLLSEPSSEQTAGRHNKLGLCPGFDSHAQFLHDLIGLFSLQKVTKPTSVQTVKRSYSAVPIPTP